LYSHKTEKEKIILVEGQLVIPKNTKVSGRVDIALEIGMSEKYFMKKPI
jgi:hypothetical protein